MPPLQVRHVQKDLQARFKDKIDLSDVNAEPDHREKVFLTRALAAATIGRLAGLDDQAAANCVTDGTNDNGLDAIAVLDGSVLLIQSKWDSSGHGSIALGDLLKFKKGVEDLTDFAFERFNKKIQARQTEIEAVLDLPEVRLELVVVTTGSSAMSAEAQGVVGDFVGELNDPQPLAAFRYVSMRELHGALTAASRGDPIDLVVSLENYGFVNEPYRAYYGVVDGAAVAEWYGSFQDRLFHENIRKPLGTTPVNSAIRETARDASAYFWYFNNGITLLSDTIAQSAKGSTSRGHGEFTLKGAGIVNGAQTVTSLYQEYLDGPPDLLADVKVWVRMISLEGAPRSFASDVTRATNTQNSIENRDFVALDDQQARLQHELFLEEQKRYAYKRGDELQDVAAGCTLQEATVALACAQPDVELAVLAKSAVGRLWASTDSAPYTTLFNAGLSARKMWRLVELMRLVDEELLRLRRSNDGRARAIAIHGNRLLLHLVLRGVESKTLDEAEDVWRREAARATKGLESLFDAVVAAVERCFPSNYVAVLFKNVSKCKELMGEVNGSSAGGRRTKARKS